MSENETSQKTADQSQQLVRQMLVPSLLVQVHAGFGYMMPENLLPWMECEKCQWHQEEWRDGGFCYMFRVQPPGERCGQMKAM